MSSAYTVGRLDVVGLVAKASEAERMVAVEAPRGRKKPSAVSPAVLTLLEILEGLVAHRTAAVVQAQEKEGASHRRRRQRLRIR